MKLSKELEAEVMQVYETWLNSYLNGDVKTYDYYFDEGYHFIGSTNNEEFLNRKDTTKFFERTAEQFAGKAQIRDNTRHIEELDGMIFITHFFNAWFQNGSDWFFYGRFRFSSTLHKTDNGWRFIYQHFSMPDSKAEEGESIGLEKISKENEELRDAVKRRTIELEEKNRQLAIESAVERVRAKALAMHQSAEILQVVRKLKEEVMALNIPNVVAATIHLEEKNNMHRVWDLNSIEMPGGKIHFPIDVTYRLEETDPQFFMRKIWSGHEKYFLVVQDEADIKRSIQWLKDNGLEMQAAETEEFVKATQLKNLYHPTVQLERGRMSLDLLDPPSDEIENILSKMAAAFDLAYKRFEDLKKAEAQTREAQIEAALERVRSRAMAMQKSEELADVATIMFKELNKLVDNLWVCGFVLCEKGRGEDEWWLSDQKGFIPAFYLPNTGDVTHANIYQAWNNGASYHTEQLEGAALQEHYDWLMSLEPSKKIFNQMLESGFQLPEWQKLHCAFFKTGYLVMITRVPCYEEEIFKRFAQVFDMTYTRFLDLQKAEALAKQAKEDLVNLKAEKKRTEEALSELKNTQSQLIHAEKMASLGELTAGVAHEIQNPLNFVNNFSELNTELIDELEQELVAGNVEEIKEIIINIKENEQKINHHGKRADSIVKGMLQHSRGSGGIKASTDMNVLLDEYIRLTYHGLRARDNSLNVNIITDFDNTIGSIDIIPQDMGRVILNLLTNAFYACTERSRSSVNNQSRELEKKYEPVVSVRSKKTDSIVEVYVTDNGQGIPQEVVNKIFQPFFTTKPTGEGTGLGLSLSYDIVKAHGGQLKVETTEGEGSTFIISLPV